MKDDPRLAKIALILAENDAWVSASGGDKPIETAAALAEKVIDFLVKTGLNLPFDYMVQDEMRGGFDNPPPAEDDIVSQERAVLRGKARLIDFIIRLTPEAFHPSLAETLISDAWRAANGEQPLIGKNIPRSSQKQDNPSLFDQMLTHAIKRSIFEAEREGYGKSWKRHFEKDFGSIYGDATLNKYAQKIPVSEREEIREAGKAARASGEMTETQRLIQTDMNRWPVDKIKASLNRIRANNWD